MGSKQESPALPDSDFLDDDIVDGGVVAWSTVIGGFLTVATTFGYANSFGVYQDLYTRSNTASASAISWIGSTQIFLLLAVGLPAGKLLDMGHFRITILVGSLIFVFSLFMLSISHTDKFYQLYLSQGLGMGIGAGLLYVPCMAVQVHHWRARRALAMGIVALGTSLGGIIFPIMLNQLFKSSAGFQWGVRVSAFIVLGMLIFANLLMKAKPPAKAAEGPKTDLKGIMTDKPYLISIFSIVVIDWAIFFPYFYLQLFAVLHNVNAHTAFYTIAILNAAAIPGRVFPNMLADHFGSFNVGIPCAISCGILVFAMLGAKTVASVVVLAILYGFMSGAFMGLIAPMFAVLCKDPNEMGTRLGIAFFITAFGALMGSPIDGALLGKAFHWVNAIIFSGVSILVGGIALIMARQLLVNRIGSQFV